MRLTIPPARYRKRDKQAIFAAIWWHVLDGLRGNAIADLSGI